MKIEDQCVSLELAKQMKSLNFEQDSLFYWVKVYGLKEGEEFTWVLRNKDEKSNKCEQVSAFTVAELGSMKPQNVIHWEYDDDSKTEADARAKCLTYLKKNKLI